LKTLKIRAAMEVERAEGEGVAEIKEVYHLSLKSIHSHLELLRRRQKTLLLEEAGAASALKVKVCQLCLLGVVNLFIGIVILAGRW